GFHTGPNQDAITARARSLCDAFVTGARSAAAWRDAVASATPHILLYPEVGMDPVAAGLAAQRPPPAPCVAGGRSQTTGPPTMDHFLSADLMEPRDGDVHYT